MEQKLGTKQGEAGGTKDAKPNLAFWEMLEKILTHVRFI